MGERDEARYAEVQDDGSTKAACRKPDVLLSMAREVESSSESDSSDGAEAPKTSSTERVPIAVVEVTRPTT